MIGTWINGKPLYRRVYTTYSEQSDASFRFLIIDVDTTKEPIFSYGSLNMLGTICTLPTPDIGFGNISGVFRNGIGQLYMTLSDKNNTIGNLYCVLLYTKTTD
jgi:hypothetical protein